MYDWVQNPHGGWVRPWFPETWEDWVWDFHRPVYSLPYESDEGLVPSLSRDDWVRWFKERYRLPLDSRTETWFSFRSAAPRANLLDLKGTWFDRNPSPTDSCRNPTGLSWTRCNGSCAQFYRKD